MYIVIISAEQQVFVIELNTFAILESRFFRGYFIMKRSMDVHCLYNTFLIKKIKDGNIDNKHNQSEKYYV